MRSDIDALMEEAGHDFLLVRGPSIANPNMVYFTGYANMTFATLIKKRGEEAVLICNPMERDEAAKAGLRLKNIDDYGPMQQIEAAGGDMIRASAKILSMAFDEFEVRGQGALYGRLEIGEAYALMRQFEMSMPTVKLVGESRGHAVLARARMTKDADEVGRIRHMGQITTAVVAEIADFLTSQRVRGDTLIDREGQPVTIGAVRRQIDLQLARRGADNPDATIFAMGHDAAVPHSIGRDDEALRLGRPIIFDIFPSEPGGGYYYDFTRTWCLGYAPDDVLQVYQDVLDVYNSLLKALHAGGACRDFQYAACDIFENRGHPTQRTVPNTERGFVHSLGHGLGLDVHEAPIFSGLASNDDILEPGSVITLEPGLYYPDQDLGVRLEDTLWMRPDGTPEILATYPLDLVLRMNGA
jgi:Xaa-Pro aminopeptidase